MPRRKLRDFFRKKPSEEGQAQTNLPLRNANQVVDDSTQNPSEPVQKQDLWQRAYDDLEPKEKELLQRISIPKSDEFPEPIDANVDPSVVDRLKALNGVVETVKIQYEIDKEKSKIKEPIHKILQATLSFQDIIKAFAAFDPTGHAPSVWAVVSLGLTMTQNYRSQKEAWLESCVYLTDILARYGFIEAEYHKDPKTDHHVETALVQVYVAVLRFAAKVQSRVDGNRVVLFGKSILGNALADLEECIDKAESQLGQWLEIVDRQEQRGRGEDLVKKVDTILNEFERVMGSLDELHGKFDLSGLKTAQEARYNAYTGEEYQECLPETRVELLKEIKLWATDPDQKATFWLQGMAGTGKSTVSRTVARWLDKEGLLGGSFFFKKNGTDRDNAKRLFTTLTKQMLERLPHLREPVQKAIKETPAIVEGMRLQEQFNELLFKPLQRLDLGLTSPLVLVVVIDALDECQVPEDIKAFLSTLPQLNQLKRIQLRVFITSRPEIPVIRGLRSVNYEEIILHEIEESIIKHDIAAFFHEKLKSIRDSYGLEKFWPGEEALLALVNMATPLFIYAATICRFVDSELPRRRLRAVLSTPSSGGASGIDQEYAMLAGLYSSVLKDIVSGKQPKELKEFMDDFQQIVGAIVLLFSPLSSAALSELIQLDKETTQGRLSTLRSVLSVPRNGDETTPIQLLHLSFREFLVSQPASADFWIDEKTIHTKLTVDCLGCMNRGLKRDICLLLAPGARNHEVEKTTIDKSVSPGLQYACRYWIRHLSNSDESAIDWAVVEDFFKLHLLHWLEVLSLLGWMSEAIENIYTLQSLVKEKSSPLAAFLEDARRFVLKNQQLADEVPLQIYYSGLVFAPQRSIIRKTFDAEFPTWFSQSPRVEEDWSAELQVLEGHSSGVTSVAISSDNRILASGSTDQTVRLWDTITGDLKQILEGHSHGVNLVAFSPNGQLLASASNDGTVRLWEPEMGAARLILQCHANTMSVAFSPDGQLLASGSDDGTVRLWDPVTGSLQHTFHGSSFQKVYSIAFSSDGKLLASASLSDDLDASENQNLKIWELRTGNLRHAFGGNEEMFVSVAFSPDNRILAASRLDGVFQIIDLETGNLLHTLEGNLDGSLAFSPDGRLLACAGLVTNLWHLETGKLQRTIKGNRECIAFSPNSRLLASGSSVGKVRLWDPWMGDMQQTSDEILGQEVQSFTATSYRNLQASECDQKLMETFTGHSKEICSIAFSPDGLILASGSSDCTVCLWDPVTSDLKHILKGHSEPVDSVVFAPDGQLLASTSRDRTVRLWDPTTGSLQHIFDGHRQWVNPAAFSPNSQLLASCFDNNMIRLWDLKTGSHQMTLEGHSGGVKSVAFSPNGRVLASGSDDQTVKLWDPVTGDLQNTLTGHSGIVVSVVFSPNGQRLASGSVDKTVRLWNPVTGHQLQVFRNYEGLSMYRAVQWVKFSQYGSYLITDLGFLDIQPWDENDAHSSNATSREAFAREEWINLDREDVLWLPPDFRPRRPKCQATHDNLLVLGHWSGQISFFRFRP